MSKRFIIAGVLVIVAAVSFFFFKVSKAVQQTMRAFEEELPPTYALTHDDSMFLNDRSLKKITVSEVRNSKVRPSISVLLYDSSYWLYRCKVALKTDLPLNKIFHEEHKGAETTTGQTYGIINDADYYSFRYAAGPLNAVSQIYFTISADSLETIKSNDSLVAFHCLLYNLSLKYEEDHPVDIYVAGENSGIITRTIIPADILFVKKDSALYFSLMSPTNNKYPVSANLLLDITTK